MTLAWRFMVGDVVRWRDDPEGSHLLLVVALHPGERFKSSDGYVVELRRPGYRLLPIALPRAHPYETEKSEAEATLETTGERLVQEVDGFSWPSRVESEPAPGHPGGSTVLRG